jgi:dipeptidase E
MEIRSDDGAREEILAFRAASRARLSRFRDALERLGAEGLAGAARSMLSGGRASDAIAALDLAAFARQVEDFAQGAGGFLDALESGDEAVEAVSRLLDSGDSIARDQVLGLLPTWPELADEVRVESLRRAALGDDPLLSYKYLYYRSLTSDSEGLAADMAALAASGVYGAMGALSYACDSIPSEEDFEPTAAAAESSISGDPAAAAFLEYAKAYVAAARENALEGRTDFSEAQRAEFAALAPILTFTQLSQVAYARLQARGGGAFGKGELDALRAELLGSLARPRGAWNKLSPNRAIVAIGGGELGAGETAAVDEAIASLSRGDAFAFLPAASGDSEPYVATFERAFGVGRSKKVSAFAADALAAVHARVASSDAVYVGGGDSRKLLSALDSSGIESALRECYVRGGVLSGISAGALCWFDLGICSSGDGAYAAIEGLGFARGAFCPHYDPSNQAQAAVIRELARSTGTSIWLVPDRCALIYADGRFYAINDPKAAGKVCLFGVRNGVEEVPEA